MSEIGKALVLLGILLVLAGLLLWAGAGKGWFSWLGRLPGDVRVEKGGSGFYFPIVTCLVISVLLSLILTVISRFWRK